MKNAPFPIFIKWKCKGNFTESDIVLKRSIELRLKNFGMRVRATSSDGDATGYKMVYLPVISEYCKIACNRHG